MLAIFWRTFKDRRISLLIYSLAAIGLILVYVAIYPSIQAQSASFETLLKTYPEGFLKAFNIDLATYTTIEGYLSAEQFSFVYPLMVIFILVGYAGAAIAGEIEKGTIETLLSAPVSRLKIFLGKYFSGLFILAVFTALSTLSIAPILSAYRISYHMESFAAVALLSFMFGLSIFSLSIFLSAIFSDKGKVYFLTGGTLVLMYVLNIVAALKDNLSDLKYFSFFYYFNPNNALIHRQIDHLAYWVFLGTALIFAILGAIWFSKRDIAV